MTTYRQIPRPATRRVLALWLPHLPAERPEAAAAERPEAAAAERPEAAGSGPERGPQRGPFAVWQDAGNRRIILAANRAARAAGVRAGQALADARAALPGLATAPADTAADARRLHRLAAWCRRYAPWTAPMREGGPGIWIEAGGSAHLFGGEEAMCRAVLAALARAGHEARAGLAGTPGTAWALARTAKTSFAIAQPGEEREVLAPLPVAVLRLDATTVEALCGLGLRRVGDLYPLVADGRGRAELARRFPPLLLARLDAALGHVFEPIGPDRDRARHLARLALPEPVREAEAVARIARHLVHALCPLLARDGLGARRVVLTAFRSDGRAGRIALGTARPLADATALLRLLDLRLAQLETGPGADAFTLEATTVEPLRAMQSRLDGGTCDNNGDDDDAGMAPLVERLAARLGNARVGRLEPRPNHLPERAQGFATLGMAASSAAPGIPETAPGAPRTAPGAPRTAPGAPEVAPPPPVARPLRLLARPEAVAAAALVPDGPPAWFRRRGGILHQVARAEGPERIALDWWRLSGWQNDPPTLPEDLADALRDYWRVEDSAGARFWLFRDGPWRAGAPERWYLHGLFP